ncbi:hypothetical protein K435DRAFT_928560 [Dendrothele bispora CBS 962.96]|uniref:Uncharacterized protein n=1 Tax=Dendrothele bispora (strain CBS 962.96) TaxID=1314807 RepID=A0A4S8L6H7_DENBC|nr:hypothetical protein K435DRAFT_928560 [Dendrothele bispora CBS 962.96]
MSSPSPHKVAHSSTEVKPLVRIEFRLGTMEGQIRVRILGKYFRPFLKLSLISLRKYISAIILVDEDFEDLLNENTIEPWDKQNKDMPNLSALCTNLNDGEVSTKVGIKIFDQGNGKSAQKKVWMNFFKAIFWMKPLGGFSGVLVKLNNKRWYQETLLSESLSMPSFNFIYISTLSASFLVNALSIVPIGTVTQYFPVTVTWFRETDDPENWVFRKSDDLGIGAPIMVDSTNLAGDTTITLTDVGSFYELLAFQVGSNADPGLGGTSSVLPSDSSSTGRSQNNANISTIVGGSVGAVGFFVLILVFLFCRRRGKRGVHWRTSRRIIDPFRWSSPGMTQTSDTSARLHDQRVGGETSNSEVATAGHDPGHDESESSLVTARNARIPVQRQFRIAGRAFTKSKTPRPLEKRQSAGDQWEVSDRVDHGDDERIGDPPSPVPAERRSPAMQENGDRTPNIMRHLDSGIRVMQLPSPGLARGQRMTQRDNGGRGFDSGVVEDIMEPPPEYSTFV